MADDAKDDQNSEQCDRFEPIDRLSSTTMKRRPQMELNKTDLLRLLSYLEGELQGRDITIAALKAEKTRNLVHQAKYGRFGLEDPLLALQRDHSSQKDASPANEERATVDGMYQSQMKQLDNLIETQKKAQMKMRDQLISVEKRYHKVCGELEDEKRKHAQDTAQGDDVTYLLEKERERLKNELEFEKSKSHRLEKEVRKLNAVLSETNSKAEKNKHVALLLLKERKQLLEAVARLAEDNYLSSGSEPTTLNSNWHEERLQLRARIEREESRSKNLQTEIEHLKSVIVNSQANSVSNVISSKLPIKVSSNRPTPPQTPPTERRRLSPQDNANSSSRSPLSSKPTAETTQIRANTTIPNLATRPQAFASAISSIQSNVSPIGKGKKPIPPVRTSTLSSQPPPVPPNKPGGRSAPIRTFQSPSDRYQTAENPKRETKNGPQANERESGIQSDLSFLDQNIQDFQKTYGSLQDKHLPEDISILKSALISGSLGDLHMILNNSDIDINELFVDCNMGPIHLVCFYGHTECLRVLLEKCPDSIFVLNDNGDSALHISALKNKADSCKVLLEKYPELSLWQNKQGKVALHIAAEYGSLEAFESIISVIISPQALLTNDENLVSVIEAAVRSSKTDWIEIILRYFYIDFCDQKENQHSLISIASDNVKQYIVNFSKIFLPVSLQVQYDQTADIIGRVYLTNIITVSDLFKKAEDYWKCYLLYLGIAKSSENIPPETIKWCSIGTYKIFNKNSTGIKIRISDLISHNETVILKIHLDEGNSTTLALATLIPISLSCDWIEKLEKKKHLIFVSPKNSGKKFCSKNLASVLQFRLCKNLPCQTSFVSDGNNNENEIYVQLISFGALIDRNKKRDEDKIQRIVVFCVENSACCNVFSVISHFLHKRGPENCVRLKLTEKDVTEYYVPQNCYLIISFETLRYNTISPSVKHNLQTFGSHFIEEPFLSLVKRYWNKNLVATLDTQSWICASWIDHMYKNLNSTIKKLGMRNIAFGPTKFFAANVENLWSTSNWIVSEWNSKFVPYVKKNLDKNMIDTALNVLIQRSILPHCPLNLKEKEIFFLKLEGHKAKDKREKRVNERRISTPLSRQTPTLKKTRPYSAGDRKLISPFKPLQNPSEHF